MILCPNTGPLIVLARLDRLDLLGGPGDVILTGAVLAEIRDKRDTVSARIDGLASRIARIVDVPVSDRIDPYRSLGPGERGVLSFALTSATAVTCVLDDRAARAEARRLGLSLTGTLGVILRAKLAGQITSAGRLLRDAVGVGLYLHDDVLRRALEDIDEPWPVVEPGHT